MNEQIARLLLPIICCSLSHHMIEIKAQINNTYPLVSVPDATANIDNTTEKVFTTTLNVTTYVANQTELRRDVIITSLEQIYSGSLRLDGFIGVGNFHFDDDVISGNVQVTYDVTYNYAALKASNGDLTIAQSVGSVTRLRQALDDVTNFTQLFSLALHPFRFTGESVCAKVGCPQGSHTLCEEVRGGLTTWCGSPCKRSYCVNDGWCVHQDAALPPLCSCPASDTTWYVGNHCETPIFMWVPILFFCLVAAILLVVVATACFFLRELNLKKFDVSTSRSSVAVRKLTSIPNQLAQAVGIQTKGESLIPREELHQKMSSTPSPRGEPSAASVDGSGRSRATPRSASATSRDVGERRRSDDVTTVAATSSLSNGYGTSFDDDTMTSSSSSRTSSSSARWDGNTVTSDDLRRQFNLMASSGNE